MNSYQITKVLSSNPTTKSNFLGVFARDELPIISKLPCSFVLNTQNRDKPGEHWLAFFYDNQGKAEFFDPVAISPNYYNLDKYLNTTSKAKWNYNKTRVQSFFSKTCGHFCVFYIYFKSLNYNLNDIILMFSNNLEKNDILVKNFIKYIL